MKSIYCIITYLCINSCVSQQKVISFTNDDSNFGSYHSYNIINYKKGEEKYSLKGELMFQQIETEISKAMEVKNYNRSKNPDIIVRYEIISSVNVVSNNNINQSNRYNGVNNQYDRFNTPVNNSRKQIEGVLLIELKDKKSKKLIWQASLDLKYSKKKGKILDPIPDAIQTIFKDYLYVAGSNKPIIKDK